jgi:Zn-dependent protease
MGMPDLGPWADLRGLPGRFQDYSNQVFAHRIRLFSLAGFPVYVDWSWTIIALLVAWSLATGLFPRSLPGQAATLYWALGGIAAGGLFFSIVLHEVAHSVVARRFGIKIRGITLFVFGGVAEMEDEPPTARSELWMAVAGPAMSLFLAGVFFALALFMNIDEPFFRQWALVSTYLARLNLALCLFNLIPAFPLDGGRVFRAGLWAKRKDLRSATRTTSAIGSIFGVFLIVAGVFNFIRGSYIGGTWLFVIGLFLRNAARGAYRNVLVKQALEGARIEKIMQADPLTVAPTITVAQLVEDHVYRYHHRLFPVIQEGVLLGSVSTREIREVPREDWSRIAVGDIFTPRGPLTTIEKSVPATRALARMQEMGQSRLMVVDGDVLVGMVTLRDLLAYLSVRGEVEGGALVDDQTLSQL